MENVAIVWSKSTPHALLALATLAIGLTVAFPACASSDLSERVRLLVDERVLPAGGEVEVVVGEPDARLKLAPCARMEPFVPSGARQAFSMFCSPQSRRLRR